jgi:hypothetical protein
MGASKWLSVFVRFLLCMGMWRDSTKRVCVSWPYCGARQSCVYVYEWMHGSRDRHGRVCECLYITAYTHGAHMHAYTSIYMQVDIPENSLREYVYMGMNMRLRIYVCVRACACTRVC